MFVLVALVDQLSYLQLAMVITIPLMLGTASAWQSLAVVQELKNMLAGNAGKQPSKGAC